MTINRVGFDLSVISDVFISFRLGRRYKYILFIYRLITIINYVCTIYLGPLVSDYSVSPRELIKAIQSRVPLQL